MRWKKILSFCVVSIIIGYFIGVNLPYKLGLINVSDTPISKGDYYGNLISLFEAIGTCSAVIVALFLNEIRAWFKKVTFDIKLSSDDVFEEVIDIKGTKKAFKYHNHLQIFNAGNVNAQNCELVLENADFFLENGKCTNSLSVGNEPINWNNRNTTVYIPSLGRKVLHIFEIIAPQKQSNPDGKDDNIKPAEYIFWGLSKMEAKKGKWELSYCGFS